MEQMSMFSPAPRRLTVSELSRILRELLESERLVQDIWVQGEISNFSQPKSGHWYFTLKDRNAQLPCVMWRSTAELQARVPQDGQSVEVHGGLSVYEAGGRYQLYVDEIRSAGEGRLYQQYLELKARLEAEGLFDPERKRALPAWPRRIGIVTSPSGAALHDMLQTLGRRYPLADVVFSPATVQGDGAAFEVIAALQRLNQYAQPDVILLARGGGSLEDLAAFNSEKLARAIAASPAPVVCGVGHETDFTLADFAADLRAPTPTAAAELATPNRGGLEAGLLMLKVQLQRNSPEAIVRREQQRVDELAMLSQQAFARRLELRRAELVGKQARLASLNPAAVLERGYAIVSKADGATVRSRGQVTRGEPLQVRVSDGEFGVEVKGE